MQFPLTRFSKRGLQSVITALVALAIVHGSALCQSSDAAKPLKNEDVVAMVKASLRESTIIAAIASSPNQFRIDAESLIALKKAGVTDPIIEAIVKSVNSRSASQAPSTGSSSVPSPEDAEGYLRGRAQQDSGGRLALEGFRKTDGVQGELFGHKTYIMQFDAEVRFVEPSRWYAEGTFAFNSFKAAPVQPGAIQLNFGVEGKKGEGIPIVGTIMFSRTERGWGVERLEMKLERSRTQPRPGAAAADGGTMQPRGASASSSSSSEVPPSVSPIPITSGPRLMTKFGIRNQTFRPIKVFLDDSDTPIEIRTNYQDHLEVGSTHTIRVVVGSQVFQARFTVPRVMRDIRVTPRGLDIQ